jgi:hypothetical protein
LSESEPTPDIAISSAVSRHGIGRELLRAVSFDDGSSN